MKQFRVGLVSKAHRLCVSLDSRLESNKEEEEEEKSAFERKATPGHRQKYLKLILISRKVILISRNVKNPPVSCNILDPGLCQQRKNYIIALRVEG